MRSGRLYKSCGGRAGVVPGAEEFTVLGQEAQDQTTSDVGPEHAGGHRSTRIKCQSLETKSGESTQDREENEIGDGVEFCSEACNMLTARRGGSFCSVRVA